MQEKRRSGASYRAIEQWLRQERGIQMSFMGVKDVLLKAEMGAENF
jgi:hypothetical protein